jgi:hypothetical protein
MKRAVAAIEKLGLYLGDGIRTPDTLAACVAVAVTNRANGRRNRNRRYVRLSQGVWDEAKHPRGQPQNAGEFAPKGAGGAGPAHAFPSGEELAAGRSTDLKAGGQVRRVEVGGKPHLVKQAPRTAETGKFEVLSSELAHIAGVNMPPAALTTIRGKPALVQGWVGGDTVAKIKKASPAGARAALATVPKEEIDRNVLFDYLMGHSDVHDGNYMVSDDGHLVAIDKEMVLGRGNLRGQRFEPPHLLSLTRPDGAGMLHPFDRATVGHMASAGDKMAAALDAKGMKREARQVRDRAVVLKKLAAGPNTTAGDLYNLGSRGVTPPNLGLVGKIKWHLTKG